MFSLTNLISGYWPIQTAVFSAIFLIGLALSWRKKTADGPVPKEVSNELRGLAILGVFFTHLTYGLFWGTDFLFPFGIWGGVAVDMFFFLSGYGLAASAIYHPKSIVEFYRKRVVKIIVPLWTFLLIILAADALILHRFYPATEIAQAFLGYFPIANLFTNINSPLWFITPLIGYYVIFPLVFRQKHPFLSLIPLFAFSALAFYPGLPVSYQIAQYYKVHAWAFPLGALFASLLVSPAALCVSCQRIKNCFLYQQALCGFGGNFRFKEKPIAAAIDWLKAMPVGWRAAFLAAMAFLAGYTAYYSGVGKGVFLESAYALFTMFCLLFLFLLKRGKFHLLEIIGVYSFEIYLWHWPLISRYGFLYAFLPPWLATILYLPLLILAAYLFKLAAGWIESWLAKIKWKKIPA